MENIVQHVALLSVSCTLWFVAGAGDPIVADDWNQFRGCYSNGHADAKDLPCSFGEQENLVWKVTLPGRGWSTPIVVDDQIWLTTAYETPATKDKLEELATTGLTGVGRVSLRALCLDRETGRILQEIELFDVDDPPPINPLNSYASPTPIADEQFVYCSFGSMGTACIDREDHRVVWRHRRYQVDHETGPGSSPILYRDNLILTFDGIDDQFVVALAKSTGKEIWRTPRSGQLRDDPTFQKAFSTPLLTPVNGEDQLISPASDWVYGYDPRNGKELWRLNYDHLGFSNAPQPVRVDQRLFICTGFTRSQLLAIDLASGRPDKDDVLFRHRQQVPAMSTPVAVGQRLFFVSDGGIATCLDNQTGEVLWRERLSGNYSASPIYADGKLFFGSREGEVHVILPSGEFQRLAANELDGPIMSTPVACDRSLWIRTEKSLYHFQQSE